MKHIAKTSANDFGMTPGMTPETAAESNRARSNSDRAFFRIASFSTALAFGFMFGSLESLRKDASGIVFHLSSGTLVAFVIGAAVALAYWKIVLLGSTARATSLLRMASFLLILEGVGAFLYPMRFVSRERLIEMSQGLAVAAIALSTIGLMLWRLKKFFDQDAVQMGNSLEHDGR